MSDATTHLLLPYILAPVDGTYLFGATLLYKINASATARKGYASCTFDLRSAR